MQPHRILRTTALLLTSVATAQQNNSANTSGFQMTPEMRARMAAMQPVLDLSQTVRLLPELEKNKATAVTKTQAKTLLTILTTLQKASAVQPNDAKKYLAQIEDKILTEKQLTALDTLLIKAEQAQQAQRAARQSGQPARIPGLPGGLLGGQRPGGQTAQRSSGTAQAGVGQRQPGAFNPFKEGRGADMLTSYLALLKKK
ncbi:hypothetical protein E7T06_02295 [Deinococcus sp. Arct2-2]|uniref:hypothetical protein n=1 Tax=Deinococcus sp. Arct2-2 TaxID=2568653 RepID=UPI0010A4E5D6|nr:hypothetical protein [Deinococcus sp. Arct2-2]THF71468.1 hypothetical protein E7T06_02295 [Deinococcus sp. Arct2-2]